MEENNVYPRVILGLDISTACIGACLVVDDGKTDLPRIEILTHKTPKVPRKIKGIEALFIRKQIFEDEFIKKILYSPVLKDIGKNSIFVGFEKPIKKYTALSMPLTDSANSFLEYNELFYAFTSGVTLADYITLTMAKANYGPTRIYKERLEEITEV